MDDVSFWAGYSWLQKKTGNKNFPNVNLVWATCQLNVYLTVPTNF
jgi:hypothetical protein